MIRALLTLDQIRPSKFGGSFNSTEAAVDALKTITEAIEQRVSLIEL